MPIETETNVIQHINNSFPAVEPHYVRQSSKKLYLSELLNISLMYRLYKVWFEEGNFESPMATQRQYQTIFNTKFNYSFFKPKKEQCSKCTVFRGSSASVQEKVQDI